MEQLLTSVLQQNDHFLGWYATDEMLKEVNYAIFKVYWLIPPRRTQFVLLLSDGSHVCTCRLLQNKGLVRMHVFHLKRDNDSVKYHIHLIPRRWFKESMQDNINLEGLILDRPFILSATCQYSHPISKPDVGYMDDYLDNFPRSLPDPPRKRQYQGEEDHASQVSDPPEVKGKGRPKNNRFISNLEKSRRGILSKPSMASRSLSSAIKPRRVSTCSKCEKTGHNKATCKIIK